jgi:hypothetical protein
MQDARTFPVSANARRNRCFRCAVIFLVMSVDQYAKTRQDTSFNMDRLSFRPLRPISAAFSLKHPKSALVSPESRWQAHKRNNAGETVGQTSRCRVERRRNTGRQAEDTPPPTLFRYGPGDRIDLLSCGVV